MTNQEEQKVVQCRYTATERWMAADLNPAHGGRQAHSTFALSCLAFSRPRSEGRPHYELSHSFSMQICCPLSGLQAYLRASVLSMKCDIVYPRCFRSSSFSIAGQGPFNNSLFKRFVFTSHDVTEVSTFHSKCCQ